MAKGKGKYNDLCTLVRRSAFADGALVMVFNGVHGHGFSLQIPAKDLQQIPRILRETADKVEKDLCQQP